MAKVYLIYYDPTKEDKKFTDRIVKIGDRFQIDKTTFLVKSDLSCIDIYDGFTSEPFENMEVLITEVNPQNTFGLWGPEIWKFFELYNENEEVPTEQEEVPTETINQEEIPEA